MSGAPPIRVNSPKDLDALAKGPAILLSASVPVKKDYDGNGRHLETARPELIRAAVVELAKRSFAHDVTLVFGGHPAISPMVVEVARRFLRNPHEPRVFVFQSEFFTEESRPRATHDLVRWDAGRLVLTPRIVVKGEPDREESLALMRKIMVSWPVLIAAVFVGGMDGVVEEARLFKQVEKRDASRRLGADERPCFAIASAGGAAADLPKTGRFEGLGRHVDSSLMEGLLRHSESYPLVMQEIFRELGIPPGDHHGPARSTA